MVEDILEALLLGYPLFAFYQVLNMDMMNNNFEKGVLNMSGPSLKKTDAHSSIHEAALNEARDLRELYRQCLEKEEKEKGLHVAEVIIEHWETRTLAHAESEETGLYKEMVEENPNLQETVIQLTRDHDLMRNVVEQMKELLAKKQVDEEFMRLLDGMIVIDEIHNEDEMNKLLANDKE